MAKLADLKLGLGAVKRFTFERPKMDGSKEQVTVAIRALTKTQIDEARVQAQGTVDLLDKNIRENASYDELLREARVVEMLARALRDADKPDEAWANPLEIGQTFDLGTIGLLAREYEEHQSRCSPFLQDLTDEQFEAMVDAIAKEGDADPFFFCASPLQSAFVVTLARALVKSRMANSSSSSASAEPSTESTPSDASANAAATADDIVGLRSDIAVLTEHIASMQMRMRHYEADVHRSTIGNESGTAEES